MKLLHIVCLFLLGVILPGASPWLIQQPKENVQVTLAKALKQDSLCLQMGSASDPMSTCLVVFPWGPKRLKTIKRGPDPTRKWDLTRDWDGWMQSLPHANTEPQELDLLESAKARVCVNFGPLYHWRDNHSGRQLPPPSKDVSPINKKRYTLEWCNGTDDISAASIQRPRKLPKGLFLLCGDRAWAGIPSQLRGGPCTLGRLSVLAPNKTQLLDWQSKNQLTRLKRQIQNLDQNCSNEVVGWSFSKRVAVSLFLPWVAAAKALGELSHLECWLGWQANLTSSALTELLEDEETTRHATLQNRAAIDCLLLAHGHGCEEFEGMCCLNLSSNSQSIHKTLQEMKNQFNKLKEEGADLSKNLMDE